MLFLIKNKKEMLAVLIVMFSRFAAPCDAVYRKKAYG